MRANGVPERYCTGDARPVREVQGVGGDRPAQPAQSALPLDAPRAEALLRHRRTARRIHCGPDLAPGERAARSRRNCRRTAFSQKFGVQALCTTDDPADDLAQSRSRFVPPTSGRGSIPRSGPTARSTSTCPQSSIRGSTGSQPSPTSRSPVSRTCRTRCASGTTTSTPPAAACPTTASPAARSRSRTSGRAAAIFDKARAGQAVSPEEQRRLLGADDALLRPARRGEGLDEAAAPRRAAQCQHPRLRVFGPRHRVRLHWRLAAGRCAGCVSRSTGPGERAAEDDRLQRQPGR